MTTPSLTPSPLPRHGAVRRLTAGAGTLTLALGLAACGSGSPSGAEEDTASAGAGSGAASGELTSIRVGAIPIGDVAPIHVGVKEGFFEDEGLDVAAVIAPADSDLESTEDLQGHTSSSNNLLNIGDTSIRLAVDNAGGDGGDMDFIELAFGDAAAAVQNGQVEAALVLEPYLTRSLDAGLKAISWPYAEAHPDLDIGGYFTSEEVIEERPEDVEAFTRAMRTSMEFSQENPEVVREVIGEYTEMEPETLERITLPRFKVDFSREAMTALGESAVKYGVIDESPDLDALLPEGTP